MHKNYTFSLNFRLLAFGWVRAIVSMGAAHPAARVNAPAGNSKERRTVIANQHPVDSTLRPRCECHPSPPVPWRPQGMEDRR